MTEIYAGGTKVLTNLKLHSLADGPAFARTPAGPTRYITKTILIREQTQSFISFERIEDGDDNRADYFCFYKGILFNFI